MVILSFISSGLEFRSVNLNHTSINENSKLKLKKKYIYIYIYIVKYLVIEQMIY